MRHSGLFVLQSGQSEILKELSQASWRKTQPDIALPYLRNPRKKKTSLWFISLLLFFNIFIMLLQLSHFSPFTPLHPAHTLPPTFSPYSSCPWVIHISSLASTFPTLFLPSLRLFSTYHLCYLFSVPFPPLSHSHSPVDNSPCDLHFCGSVPVLVVCLVCFCFCFRCCC